MDLFRKVDGLIRLMRPLNCSVAAIAVVFSLFLASKEVLPWQVYVGSAFAAFLTTSHSMVHNDIVDLEIDKVNAPYRAIPSGKVTKMQAILWACVLLILACVSGYFIDTTLGIFPFSTLWALGNALILDSYNAFFKKYGLLGNFLVAWPPYALFLYSDIVVHRGLSWEVQSIALVGLFSIFGREVIKGIYDIKGDKSFGVRTVAVVHGRKGASIIGGIIILLSVPASIPLIVLSWTNIVLPILLLIFDMVLIYFVLKVIKDPSDEVAYRTKLRIMQMMLVFLVILAVNQLWTILS